jgi:DNA-binding response OmpR family regulator
LRNRDLVLIAVTGLGDPQHRARCLEEGFVLSFVKPVSPEELRLVLATLDTQIAQQDRLSLPDRGQAGACPPFRP